MSLDDLNREQKRSLKKMGALDEKGQPTRARRAAGRASEAAHHAGAVPPRGARRDAQGRLAEVAGGPPLLDRSC